MTNTETHKRNYAEDALQIKCKYWFDTNFPDLAPLLHHSPNEGHVENKSQCAKRKAMGTRSGVADLMLFVPKGKYTSLALEFKTPSGRQSEAQREWQRVFEKHSGGLYLIVRSEVDFQNIISDYLAENL